MYVREVYDILGVLGDLGGIFEITMIVFGFFLDDTPPWKINLGIVESFSIQN